MLVLCLILLQLTDDSQHFFYIYHTFSIANNYNTGVNGKCPIGYYCTKGTLQPEPCTNNQVITKTGATSPSDCEDCPDGKICTSTVPEDCPTGFYCKSGDPVKSCPPGSYNPFVGKIYITDCLVCDAGYDCNAANITRQTDFPCPAGFYCFEATSMELSDLSILTNFSDVRVANPCPKGSYNNKLNAVDDRECLNCPAGFYCLEGSLNNTQPTACNPYIEKLDSDNSTMLKLASYCPEGMNDFNSTENEKICAEGFYCSTPKTEIVCPLSYYCPQGTQDPIRCPAGHYCEPLNYNSTSEQVIIGAIIPTLCPAGTVTLENSNQINFQDTCGSCAAGTYGNTERTECLPCQAGVICSIGSTTDIPSLNPDNYSITAYPCPKGYYCTEGSITPIPCPAGTYNRFTFGKSETESCLPCPADYFSDQEAQLGCQYCGNEASQDLPGQSGCVCNGLNREFQSSDSTCPCKYGFQASEGQVDCDPIVYDLCPSGTNRVQDGGCIGEDEYESYSACGGKYLFIQDSIFDL